MEQYTAFVDELKQGIKAFKNKPSSEWKDTALKYINGLAGSELRRLVDLETRRNSGAFFTDHELANKVFEILKPSFTTDSIVYDPAVGAGNLLIAAAQYMCSSKVNNDLKTCLLGTDIHSEFVESAKLRLKIYELLKQSETNACTSTGSGFKIMSKNGLYHNDYYRRATHIVVNPPFQKMVHHEKLKWAKGKVSSAAVFIQKIIQNVQKGTYVIAILPDVLRSGSSYNKWREMVNNTCAIEKIELLGVFNKFADVDVFAIKMRKREIELSLNNPVLEENKIILNNTRVQDLFDVSVGPVVDNRCKHEGPNRGYVISRGLVGWGEKNRITLKRKHKGKSFTGPFVVIKRTSRVGDSHRAIATIINTPTPVYVDNHLIVLKPKNGEIADCRKLLISLKKEKTDRWIDQEIRCRHLTVKVVSNIPL